MARDFYNAKAVHERFHDLAEMRSFAHRLIEQWDRAQTKPFKMKTEFMDERGGPIIWSFANHVVQLMRTVLDLSEGDKIIIAMPLIRLMVENTVTAMWLCLEPGNVRALLADGFDKRRKAIADVIGTGRDQFDQSDLDDLDRKIESLNRAKLPPFDQRCRAIEGGMDAYVIWRVLSTYSHAGMGMGDFYLVGIGEEPWLARDPNATMEAHESWLGTAVSMLIKAISVCDQIDYKRSLKSQLERAARRMGVSPSFPASERIPKARRNIEN